MVHGRAEARSCEAAMMKEIFNRGPIACGIDAGPLLKYTSGIARQSTICGMYRQLRWGKMVSFQLIIANPSHVVPRVNYFGSNLSDNFVNFCDLECPL